MARLITVPFEWQDDTADGITVAGTVAYETGTVRSGAASFKVNPTAATGSMSILLVGSLDVGYWQRAYINFAAFPTGSDVRLMTFGNGQRPHVVVTTTGKLQLFFDTSAPTQVGSDSPALSTGVWYRIEFHSKAGTGGAVDGMELRLATGDGPSVSVASDYTDRGAQVPQTLFVGALTTSSSLVAYIDDYALNDDTGASQNSWPGPGKTDIAFPVSNPTPGAQWERSSGNAARFSEIDNVPAAGYDSSATLYSAGTQAIHCRASGASGAEGDTAFEASFVTETYTALGVAPNDQLTLIQQMLVTGSNSATDTAGGLKLTNNPAEGGIETPLTTFDGGAIASAAESTWQRAVGPIYYAPSVTLGTGTTLRIAKRTNITRHAIVNAMGLVVEWVPGLGAVPESPARRRSPVLAAM